MTRPLKGGFSNSNHFNHSFWEVDTEKNGLHDTEQENKLSSDAMHYIGGTHFLFHIPILYLMAESNHCKLLLTPLHVGRERT